MVFKQTDSVGTNHGEFENDVKEYGFQAFRHRSPIYRQFENDVKEYGFQADRPAFSLFVVK